MGNYLNPGNENFSDIIGTDYVDKTDLIALINDSLRTQRRLTCVSRPRRFGKSYAVKMLSAYYDRSCDSHALFDKMNIAKYDSYEAHINKYNVIYLDIAGIISEVGIDKTVPYLKEQVIKEISQAYPELEVDYSAFTSTLLKTVSHSGHRFIAIIDEWDYLMRKADAVPDEEEKYLNFLRALFKNSNTNAIFAGVYMTGILPIKKDGSQSALSDFEEYTMLEPDIFAASIGFIETEVQDLCRKKGFDFALMKKWYDGYHVQNGISLYNPNSVMLALQKKKAASYWKKSEKANALLEYINRSYTGLSGAVARLISGIAVKVDVDSFDNDVISATNLDAVLTVLTHFGYLSYDRSAETVCIPNEEIQLEFNRNIHLMTNDETIQRIEASKQLLLDTIAMREDKVAEAIEKIHSTEIAWQHYNDEQALRGVIKLAYYTYRDYYIQFEEFKSVLGIADILFLPKRDAPLKVPALLFELKWNLSAEGAIRQILDKDYPEILKGYGGELILIGVNYNKEDSRSERKHSAKMRKIKL